VPQAFFGPPEEKGGVQQVLTDHFAKVYKVTMPLRSVA
jgi:hypothetical protein